MPHGWRRAFSYAVVNAIFYLTLNSHYHRLCLVSRYQQYLRYAYHGCGVNNRTCLPNGGTPMGFALMPRWPDVFALQHAPVARLLRCLLRLTASTRSPVRMDVNNTAWFCLPSATCLTRYRMRGRIITRRLSNATCSRHLTTPLRHKRHRRYSQILFTPLR